MAALFQLILWPWHSRGRKHSYFGPRLAVNTSLVPKNNLKKENRHNLLWAGAMKRIEGDTKSIYAAISPLLHKETHFQSPCTEKNVGNQWDKDGYNNKLENDKISWKWSRVSGCGHQVSNNVVTLNCNQSSAFVVHHIITVWPGWRMNLFKVRQKTCSNSNNHSQSC